MFFLIVTWLVIVPLTLIWFALFGRWIKGKCRWRTECVLLLWPTLLTTSGYRRPAKARKSGCSRWNSQTLSNTNTYQTKMLWTSHYVNSPRGALKLISQWKTLLTFTGNPDQQPTWDSKESLSVCFSFQSLCIIFFFLVACQRITETVNQRLRLSAFIGVCMLVFVCACGKACEIECACTCVFVLASFEHLPFLVWPLRHMQHLGSLSMHIQMRTSEDQSCLRARDANVMCNTQTQTYHTFIYIILAFFSFAFLSSSIFPLCFLFVWCSPLDVCMY